MTEDTFKKCMFFIAFVKNLEQKMVKGRHSSQLIKFRGETGPLL